MLVARNGVYTRRTRASDGVRFPRSPNRLITVSPFNSIFQGLSYPLGKRQALFLCRRLERLTLAVGEPDRDRAT